MSTKSRMLSSVAVGALALGLLGCASTSPTTEVEADTEQSTQSLTVAMVASACLPLYPTYLAKEEGFFAERGLDVSIQPVNGSAAVLQAMLANQAQVGTPGATPLIFSVAEGADVQYFANTMPGGSFSLVTMSDSGITDAAGLRGKTIGISTADGGEVAFLKAVLADAGLEEGEYELLVVGEGGQAVAGFSRGDIDAFAAAPDGVATLKTAGVDISDISGTSTGHMFGNGLATTGTFIEENPETLQQFWDAYAEAVEYGTANPDAVLETCKKYQPQEIEDPAFAEAMLEAFNKALVSPDGGEFGVNNVEHWQLIVEGLEANGELETGAVDVNELFTNQFVEGS